MMIVIVRRVIVFLYVQIIVGAFKLGLGLLLSYKNGIRHIGIRVKRGIFLLLVKLLELLWD